MNKQAYDKLVKARLTLIIESPFFGMLAIRTKLMECPWIPTMAVDGTYLYYNPNFVMATQDKHLIGDWAHEVLHLAYRHHVRMGNRDLEKWNKAADYVINADLKKAGFQLQDWVLYDPQYDGLSAEEVYGLLPDQKGGGGGQKGDGEGGGAGKGQGPAYAPDPGKQGGVVMPCNPWDQAKINEETTKWEQIARQAAAVAKAQNAGNMPGFLDRLIKELDKPRIAWDQQLINFVDTQSDEYSNFNRLNRRFITHGLKLPTLYSEKVRRIIGIMDTSGSIWCDEKIMRRFGSELSAFLDLGLCDELTVMYADTMVHKVQHFERGDDIILDPKGGGGTNFRDVMNKVKEYDDKSVVIFFTDLYTLDFGDEPDCPMIWCCYGDPRHYKQAAKDIPFGEVIYIPKD